MKLLKFRCTKSQNADEIGNVEYFVYFESDEERTVYEWAHKRMHDEQIMRECQSYYEGYWDCFMTERLDYDISEGSVWYYMDNKDDVLPELGDTFELDDMVWVRVK